jgi:hypothetical protein
MHPLYEHDIRVRDPLRKAYLLQSITGRSIVMEGSLV